MATIIFKRATSARWQEVNPILPAGEPGFITDKNILKVGDGVTRFVDLQPVNLSTIINSSRRDLLSNYDLEYIPGNGEVCFVDTPHNGLRVKIGDGLTKFKDIPYDEIAINNINSIIVQGYFKDNHFYLDKDYLEELEAIIGRVYIDYSTGKLYTYNGEHYITQSNVPTASATVAGIVKLYDTKGDNTDGTMTQRAITEELDEKVEMKVYKEEEMLHFDLDLI